MILELKLKGYRSENPSLDLQFKNEVEVDFDSVMVE
jgi:hypothetical protein